MDISVSDIYGPCGLCRYHQDKTKKVREKLIKGLEVLKNYNRYITA